MNTTIERFFSDSVKKPISSIITMRAWFKDVLQRETEKDRELHSFLSPIDGRLTKLVVQAVDKIYEGPDNCTWRRDYVRSIGPTVVRMTNWTNKIWENPDRMTGSDWGFLVFKWFGTCLALSVVVRNRFCPIEWRLQCQCKVPCLLANRSRIRLW